MIYHQKQCKLEDNIFKALKQTNKKTVELDLKSQQHKHFFKPTKTERIHHPEIGTKGNIKRKCCR